MPPSRVPALVSACCKCKVRCTCDPANHLYYNLSIGAGPSEQRFNRQRVAIQAELKLPRYQSTLSTMPYSLQTVLPKASSPKPIATRADVSNLRCSAGGSRGLLLGVFPRYGQPAVGPPLPGNAGSKARSVAAASMHCQMLPVAIMQVWRTSTLCCGRSLVCAGACVSLCVP